MTTKVAFKLPASHVAGAEEGILLGEFNDWNTAEGIYLQKQEDGSMIAELSLTAGQSYQYRYLLSDGRWVNDENAKTFSDVFGHSIENCIIDVPTPVKKAKVKNMIMLKITVFHFYIFLRNLYFLKHLICNLLLDLSNQYQFYQK